MNQKSNIINSLTGLRFYMMVIIILSHMEFLFALSGGDIYFNYFYNAYAAVSFFFILSGFGLAHSYKANSTPVNFISSVKYAIKRVKKLYPLYITLLLICFPYCIYLSMADGSTIIAAAVKNIIKLVLDVFLVQSATGILHLSNGLNSVSWFLSTLFLLYICCPALLKLNEKFKKSAVAVCLAFSINFILMLLSYNIFKFIECRSFFDALSYTSPYLRIFYLTSGILLCDIINLLHKKRFIPGTLGETAITILNIVWFFSRNSLQTDMLIKNIVDFFLCILLILIFSFESGVVSKFLSNSFHTKYGSVTMYWFLIHYPVRLYVDELFGFLPFSKTMFIGILETAVIFAITIIITNIILHCKSQKATAIVS